MLIPGTIIGDRYEIQEQVGAGGMADVYRAKDHVLERDVAVKILKPEFAEDKTFVSKFRQEAQAAAGLEHPNIVNIYDVGFENNLYYIVMEYVQGITLKTYISKKGRLNYKEVLSIAIQVARGIEAAHNKGIIHRDIKPQNIIISNEGKVKDFGIAKAATSQTMSTDAMGSVHYISPEQARNGYVTKQSDIYSLGIVMYEMVTGKVPFDGETAVSIAIQHLQGHMTKPSELVDDVPVSLEHIIEKATQKSPERRYPTMGDLLVDLKKALINPDEDFVQDIDPDSEGKTKILTPEEMEKIRQDRPKEDNFVSERDIDDEEDDDDEKVNPKMEKAITIMGIAAAVIIAVIVLVLLASFMGWFHFGTTKKSTQTTTKTEESSEKDKVTVPDLTGLTVDEVRTKLDKTGLKYEVVGKESSDSYKEGQVVRQTPKKGKKVAKNTTIQLTLSSGPAETTVAVPNVVGKSRSAAESALKELNLEVNVQYQTSDSVAQGVVISQSPKGGSDGVKEGDTVTIVVSQGQETVSVPNVAGTSQSAAVTALQNNGLTVGNISQAYNDSVAAGMVISQSVSGTQVKGTKVDLVVSLGKKPEEKPANPGNSQPAGGNGTGSDGGSGTGGNTSTGGTDNSGTTSNQGEGSGTGNPSDTTQSGQ